MDKAKDFITRLFPLLGVFLESHKVGPTCSTKSYVHKKGLIWPSSVAKNNTIGWLEEEPKC